MNTPHIGSRFMCLNFFPFPMFFRILYNKKSFPWHIWSNRYIKTNLFSVSLDVHNLFPNENIHRKNPAEGKDFSPSYIMSYSTATQYMCNMCDIK